MKTTKTKTGQRVTGYQFDIGKSDSETHRATLTIRSFTRANMADRVAEAARTGHTATDTAYLVDRCTALRAAGSPGCEYLASDFDDNSVICFHFQASVFDYKGERYADPVWFGCRVDSADVSLFTAGILAKVAKIGAALYVTPGQLLDAIGQPVPVRYCRDAREFIADPAPDHTPRQLTYFNPEAPVTEAAAVAPAGERIKLSPGCPTQFVIGSDGKVYDQNSETGPRD